MSETVTVVNGPDVTFNADRAGGDVMGSVVLHGPHGKVLATTTAFVRRGKVTRSSNGELQSIKPREEKIVLIGFTDFKFIKNGNVGNRFNGRTHEWRISDCSFDSPACIREWLSDFLTTNPLKRYNQAIFDPDGKESNSDVERLAGVARGEIGMTDEEIRAYVLCRLHGNSIAEVATAVGEEPGTVEENLQSAFRKVKAMNNFIHTATLVERGQNH